MTLLEAAGDLLAILSRLRAREAKVRALVEAAEALADWHTLAASDFDQQHPRLAQCTDVDDVVALVRKTLDDLAREEG